MTTAQRRTAVNALESAAAVATKMANEERNRTAKTAHRTRRAAYLAAIAALEAMEVTP